MNKTIQQFVDNRDCLIEFIQPCHNGETLVRWWTDPHTFKTQQLLPKDSAEWIKDNLRRNGYHQT